MKNLRKLLVGTWKSSKRLTLENCHRYHCVTGRKKRLLGSMFGKLVLRYTPTRLQFSLRGTKWTAKYDVLAADSGSIVVRIHSDELWKQADPFTADILKKFNQPRIEQLHFRRRNGRQYFWLGCGFCCEWFQKQDVKASRVIKRRNRTRFRRPVG